MGRGRSLRLFQLEGRTSKGVEAGLARHGAVPPREGRGTGADLRGIHARDFGTRALSLQRGYRADRRNQTQAGSMTIGDSSRRTGMDTKLALFRQTEPLIVYSSISLGGFANT